MAKIKDGFRGSRAIVLPSTLISEMEHDPLGAKLHITDIGYYPAAHHHFRDRKEGVSQYILIYCIDGYGWYELYGKRHAIEPNQLFILPPGTPHSYGADPKKPWTIYWIHFKGELSGLFANEFDTPITISPTNESRISDRLSIFEEIYQVLENGYSKDNIHYAVSCLYYFLGSIKYIGKFRESSGRQEHTKDVVERAIIYMKENTEKNLTLGELCAYIGYSESYFSNIFKRRTGYSPISYMSQLKIQKACHLLDFSEMKINQICHKVGIADPYYFTKLFTKIIGLSPSEYRRNKKG